MLIMKLRLVKNIVYNRFLNLMTFVLSGLITFRSPVRKRALIKYLIGVNKYHDHTELNSDEMVTAERLKFINSILIISGGVFAVIFISQKTFLNPVLLNGNSPDVLVLLTVFVPVFVSFIMFATLLNQSDNNFVLDEFLKAHWRRAGQEPSSSFHALTISFRSVLLGRVFFPDDPVPQDYNLDQFMYPAEYFGDK